MNELPPQDPMDTEEAIADLAWMLNTLEDAEGLLELTSLKGFTSIRLNLAARRLSPERQELLRQWATANQKQKRA